MTVKTFDAYSIMRAMRAGEFQQEYTYARETGAL